MLHGERLRLIAPIGVLEADDLRWYLERWAIWPSEHLRERAERIEVQLAEWGRKLWRCLDIETHSALLAAWRSASDRGWTRQVTIQVFSAHQK